MNRIFFASIFTMAGIIVSGCDGSLLTSTRTPAAVIAQDNPREPSTPDLKVTADIHD